MALIDADGRYIGEECTVALCVQRAMQHEATCGHVVINCATSSMTERIAADAGVTVSRSAVGEANVVDQMLANDATYGGEGNGGPIDPCVVLVRDSFVGMAQILDLMQSSGKTLAQLADALPPSHMHKTKVTIDAAQLPKIFQALTDRFSDAATDHSDGLRLSWPEQWLLVRASNTEPIVRLIAEADTIESAQELCAAAAEVIQAN
ncbi:MAG: hypothetical protein AAFN70_07495 [Planctomycetota bacterium]